MVYGVKFLPEVKIDLSEAKDYYFDKGGNQLAERFKTEINSEIEYIQKFPEHYQIQYRRLRRAIVKKFPYAIFYRFENKKIIIFAILHTRQDSSLIHSRLR